MVPEVNFAAWREMLILSMLADTRWGVKPKRDARREKGRAIDKVVLLTCGRWTWSPKAWAYRALQRLRQFLRPGLVAKRLECGAFPRFGLDFGRRVKPEVLRARQLHCPAANRLWPPKRRSAERVPLSIR
jgi:hypothetical protein